jgi:hypothetical protein
VRLRSGVQRARQHNRKRAPGELAPTCGGQPRTRHGHRPGENILNIVLLEHTSVNLRHDFADSAVDRLSEAMQILFIGVRRAKCVFDL